ncbi:MAG: RsbRD N-terminal domain-containing protein [bacterium]
MGYKNLITVIKNNYEDICAEWSKEANESEHMHTYQSFGQEEIFKRGKAVYDNLLKWLEAGALTAEVEEYFMEVGRRRINEGFPLTEVHFAFYLTKKVLWNFIDWRDTITGSFETATAKDIMTTLNNYFDVGNFYITRGYFDELLKNFDDSKKFSKEELKKILTKGQANFEELDEDEFIWRHV